MINHKISTPLYKQVKELIKKKVETGELKPDEKIPSERELCERYQVSRTTTRQAINESVNEGILYRVPGKGTFVARPKIDQGLYNMISFEDTVKLKGLEAYTRYLYDEELPADLLAESLNLEAEESVIHLVLLGYADHEPVVYYNSYLPGSTGRTAAITAKIWSQDRRPFSTYQLYSGFSGKEPYVTHQTFEAVLAGDETSSVLHVSKGSPIFKVTSVICNESDVPLEYKEVYYRADKFKFTVSRRHK